MRLLLLSLALTLAAHAAPEAPNPAEAKLRESLKATMLQLRTAEADKATLQADKDAAEAKAKELTTQVEKLTKQSAADQTANRKQVEELTARNTANEAVIEKAKTVIEQWRAEYTKAATIANTKETERAKLSDQNAILRRKVEDQQSRNFKLAAVAREILDRYSKFGTGEALAAREPFTGIARARIEMQVQDYGDKIEDHRLKAEPSSPKKSGPKPAPAASKKS